MLPINGQAILEIYIQCTCVNPHQISIHKIIKLQIQFYSSFRNNDEDHVNHIQSCLTQMGNLHAFSMSANRL